jgi:D-aminopeptidase
MSKPDSSTAAPAPKTGAAALDEVFQSVNRSDLPGLVVGVAQHGKPVYRRGFGLASVEMGVANTAWTRMRIGSTSKHFASLAALLLAEEGKLDLDAGIRKYLPELPEMNAEPVVRQLMNHTNGLRCHLDVSFLGNSLAVVPAGTALASYLHSTGINFAPGEQMIYNNGGYHLLSIIIARVDGKPFETVLKERILDPMGMYDTDSVPSDFEIRRGMATLHVPLPDGSYRRGIFPSEEVRGEGAMISTIGDMLTWLAHLRGPKRVGSEASWAQLLATTRLNNGHINPYGYGIMRHNYRGVEVIHHAGGVVGGSCQMLTVPSHELDIIIMSNGAMASPVELANKVIAAMIGEDQLQADDERAAAARFVPMAGTRYSTPDGSYTLAFSDADGKLALSDLNGPPVPLRDRGGSLCIDFGDLAAGPVALQTSELATAGAAPDSITATIGGYAYAFERLPAEAPSLEELAAPLLGRYRSADLDADAAITFDGKALQLQVYGNYGMSRMLLEAWSGDVFGWSIPDVPLLPLRGVLSVTRDAHGVRGFHLNTTRTRQLWFAREGN